MRIPRAAGVWLLLSGAIGTAGGVDAAPYGPGMHHGASLAQEAAWMFGPGVLMNPPVFYGAPMLPTAPAYLSEPARPVFVGPSVPVPLSSDPIGPGFQGIDPAIDPSAPGAHRPERPKGPAHIHLERARERLTVGDRLFRVGELVKARRRYEQAVAADPTAAAGYVRLAQVALARGRYREAADRFREAQTAQPGWMAFPDDVQNLFGDPGEFAQVLGELESHLQTEPGDRDGWLVLGAELYLSKRLERASDVFLRLTDRKADATLKAFLKATGKTR